jgi:hypothetical protein
LYDGSEIKDMAATDVSRIAEENRLVGTDELLQDFRFWEPNADRRGKEH